MMTAPLLEVEAVSKTFQVKDQRGRKRTVHAVNQVNLSVNSGETTGLVGESGSGKSTLARLILRLIEPDSGNVRFDGQLLNGLSGREMKDVRKKLQIVFQDPYSSLNPQMSVFDNAAFNLWVHGERNGTEKKVLKVLADVGLSKRQAQQYPHELSGGQRQRVNIARALVMRPRLVVLDEPVSALDKSVQAQVLNLLQDLKTEYRLSYIFISHDLNVVEYMSDQVAIMYFGGLMETGKSSVLYGSPKHPYTKLLMDSMPSLAKIGRWNEMPPIGEPPNPLEPPSGCAFRTRCPVAGEKCESEIPPLISDEEGRFVACHFA
ncbi:ABC transporter ATP-binding protein [Paenibacillus humicola]|uniref:ABC transporter ATP-binding protein n=1 Tax=Paenibacillus humicola TaxID=3110540 RepID=UPI00237BE6BD|nr:ABC transporter ATP-binding protein [Paenibacillus humicola]